MVQELLPQYAAAKTKSQKTQLVKQVVQTIQQASPQGGFVKMMENEAWCRIDNQQSREKVSKKKTRLHAL
jgi:hypothetical protein